MHYSRYVILFIFAIGLGINHASQVDLSGIWECRLDKWDDGEKENWFQSNTEINWQNISVPGSYNQHIWHARHYQGPAWYRTSFKCPQTWPTEGQFQLTFLGAAIRCKAWLNGEFIGEHLFPYTQFQFDISDAIKTNGDNVLVIKVDNEILDMAIPDKEWDGWWNWGGINREVYLQYRPPVRIDDFTLNTSLDKSRWQFRLSTKIQNMVDKRKATLDVTLLDSSKNIFWQSSENIQLTPNETTTEFNCEFSEVTPWSPKHPYLYTVKIQIKDGEKIIHQEEHQFGFRHIAVNSSQIFLNGAPFRVRGICRHEMYPGRGSTVPRAQTQRDLLDIKKLGCNFVRTTHYSQHPHFYEMCDKLGLLVWDEIPAWKTSLTSLSSDSVWHTYGAPQLSEMVNQNKNRTCVVVWSVGNEFDSHKPAGQDYVQRATNYVRQLDSSRLVSFASDKHKPGTIDSSFACADFIAINEYYGWYYGSIHDIGPALDRLHRQWPNKPILVSEFGCGTVPGLYNPDPPESGKDYSEDYQIQFYKNHLDQIFDSSRSSYVSGGLIWVYNDFPDPHRYSNEHPAAALYQNCKGLVTQDRRPKPAYYLVEEFYNKLAK